MDVRVDSGVEAGTEIAVAFDPMMAKLVAHAATRREAALRLARALEGLVAPGVVTNRDFLVSVLRHPAFLAGDTTTDFIERHRPAPAREPTDDALREAALAAALAAQLTRRAEAPVLGSLGSGWRNNPSGLQEARYRSGAREVVVGYLRRARRQLPLRARRRRRRAPVSPPAALPLVELEIDGRRGAFRVTPGPAGTVFVQDALGELRLEELPRFPEPDDVERAAGGYAAPMPGKVLDVRVRAGDAVSRGQALLTMEAMKMEHLVTASADGVVTEVRVAPGQQVDAGLVLVVIAAREGGSAHGR